METSIKLTKSKIGRIGEDAVALKLSRQGYELYNANNAGSNCKDIDLRLLDENGTYKSIQVKTSTSDSPYTGFKTKNHQFIDKDPEKNIVGPWVFVFLDVKDDRNDRYYILSRTQMISLLYELKNRNKSGSNKRGLSVRESLLKKTDYRDNWDNIWKD